MAPVKQDGTGKRVRWDLQLGQHMGEKGAKIPPKVVIKTRQIITKQAVKIAKRADEHEEFINKVSVAMPMIQWCNINRHSVRNLICRCF
jgi:hypothetical protein